jgi:hypothetical protein
MSDTTETKPPTIAPHFHKYITKNSEYLFSGDLCLEVRSRGSSSSTEGQGAVRQRLHALVRWSRDGGHQVVRGQLPKVGDSLFFVEGGRELLTTVVRRIVALTSEVTAGNVPGAVG